MDTKTLKHLLKQNAFNDLLTDIYVDTDQIPYQTDRYIKAVENYESLFGEGEISIYSAPGRSEIGGNHTDHQHGEVLVSAINNDVIAVVSPIPCSTVKIVSDDYDLLTISLDDIFYREDERETSLSIIKGILAGMKNRGYQIGGFQAYITSDVLIGAGLSSSAAFETILGTILSRLYNKMSISAVEIAMIGQYAENTYFGKPCGLMDQMACSVGGMVHINFNDAKNPIIEPLSFPFETHGYRLCIVDTKGSHENLTKEYAAISIEMKQTAAFFGKEFLKDVSLTDLLSNLGQLRKKVSDRAILRAFHFVGENARVAKEVSALKNDNFNEFLKNVKASGNSSYKYLQNIYTNQDTAHQNVSIALCTSEIILAENGVCRIHGGGFAGTIQAFVKNKMVPSYKKQMDTIFGKDACNILMIRKYGGIKVL